VSCGDTNFCFSNENPLFGHVVINFFENVDGTNLKIEVDS